VGEVWRGVEDIVAVVVDEIGGLETGHVLLFSTIDALAIRDDVVRATKREEQSISIRLETGNTGDAPSQAHLSSLVP